MLPPSWIVLPVPYPCCSLPCVLRVPPRSPLGGTSVAIETAQCEGLKTANKEELPEHKEAQQADLPRAAVTMPPASRMESGGIAHSSWYGWPPRPQTQKPSVWSDHELLFPAVRPPRAPTAHSLGPPSVTLSAAPSVPLNSFLFFTGVKHSIFTIFQCKLSSIEHITLLYNRRHHAPPEPSHLP